MKMTEMKICPHRHSFEEPLLKTKEQHNSEFVSRICESLTNYGESGAILVSISFTFPSLVPLNLERSFRWKN